MPPRLKAIVCGGASASVAVAVKLTVCPKRMRRSAMFAIWGGVLPPAMKFAERGVGMVMK